MVCLWLIFFLVLSVTSPELPQPDPNLRGSSHHQPITGHFQLFSSYLPTEEFCQVREVNIHAKKTAACRGALKY